MRLTDRLVWYYASTAWHMVVGSDEATQCNEVRNHFSNGVKCVAVRLQLV